MSATSPISANRALVVGMARSGIAAVRLLHECGISADGTDSNPTDAMRAELAASGANLADGADLAPYDLLVLSPGVAIDSPIALAAKERGIRVTGEVELASYYLRGPIIGITGSNGKTTTTSMIGHILRNSGLPCQVGGNIGIAPAAMISTSRDDQWNVLELSSFQLETVAHLQARIALCLNITPDHLDRHHTFAEYAAAKRRLFETQTAEGFAILNADDPACVEFADHTAAQVLWFSSHKTAKPGIWIERDRLVIDGKALMLTKEIPLPGRHNIENAMAAALACQVAGASLPQIADAIRTFPGVEHRIEFTRARAGVRYYNDSKATNVDATLKAIDAFDGRLWIILGGKDKDSDYRPLREPLTRKAHAALLIGAAARKIATQLEGAVPLVSVDTLSEAVRYAGQKATAGDIVLLAPACASFDQFDNFEHRGRTFKELVRKLDPAISTGE